MHVLITVSKQSQEGTGFVTADTPGDDDGQTGCPKHAEFYNGINLDNYCLWFVI
jgi:hypothetical protein